MSPSVSRAARSGASARVGTRAGGSMSSRDSLMDPIMAAGRGDRPGLRLALWPQAAGLYLDTAYPATLIPEVVRRRMDWRENCPPDELLAHSPFERAGKAPGQPAPIYALRLGNHRYPHMKLQIQPWPNEAGFMLSVNTHDQVAGVNLSEVDAQAFRDLQAENQQLKERIEHAWD